MKRLLQASLLILATNSAWAFNTTLRMGLTAPATGQTNYPTQFDTMFHIIDSSSAIQGFPNTFTSSNTFTGASSTVTVNQDLSLPYVGTGQCLSQGANGVIGVSCGGGGTSTLGVFNGTSGAPGVAVSSPTAGINFSSAVFTVTLQGPSTAFTQLQGSSVTLQGNTFNGAVQLTQTDGAGHLPTSVYSSGLIISTNVLQSGTTFYTSSGTAVNLNSSTSTVQTLLQVNGAGLSGSQVVGQISGSAFNVTAAGNVGLGTAVPGFALDEQQGTANFAFGIVASTVSVSSVTLSGNVTFKDGTVQNTAPVNGASTLNVSSGSVNNDVTVTSPTLKVLLDSTTFKTSLQGSATSFVTVNFKGGGLTSTILATDANGVVISTTVSGSGSGTVNSGSTGQFAYYASNGTAVSGSGDLSVASHQVNISASGSLNTQASSNQILFGINPNVTLNVNLPGSGQHVVTMPDPGGNSSIVLTTGSQTLNGLTTFTSSNTIVSTMTLSNPALVSTVLATNAFGVVVSTIVSNNGPQLSSTQTWTGINTFTSSTSIKGTTTNDNAAVGNYGEYVSSTVANVTFPSSGNFGDLASITLTQGDWDLDAIMLYFGGTTPTEAELGISVTSGNSSTGLTLGDNYAVGLPPTAAADMTLNVNTYRQSIATTTTYYMKFEMTYTSGSPKAYGRLSARRVR